MNPMQRAVLASLAARGDQVADALVNSSSDIVLSAGAKVAAVKAFKDFGDVAPGTFDSVLEAHAGGLGGNALKVALVGDSGTGVGVTIAVADGTMTVHYEPDVSTVKDVEDKISALTEPTDDIIGVRTAGTALTVLGAAAAFTATSLAGGVDPVVKVTGQIVDGLGTTQAGVRSVTVKSYPVSGAGTLADAGAGTVKKGAASTEVWLETDAAGKFELGVTNAVAEDNLITALTDNGDTAMLKLSFA